MNDNMDGDGTQYSSLRSHTNPEPSTSTMTGGGDVSSEYHMPREGRKVALIINNRFPTAKGAGYKKRNGTDVDCDKMKRLLSDLGFAGKDSPASEIIEEEDLNYEEMSSVFTKVSGKLKDAICLVVVILSYGDEGNFFGMDRRMGVDDLVNYFKADECPSLAGKPKLFFLQTCPKPPGVAEPQGEGEVIERKIPTEGDVFIVHSCIPGVLTWSRDPSQGSLFISTLTDVMTKGWKQQDIQTMMTRMLKQVDNKIRNEYGSGHKLPYVSSTLWRDLYFK